MELASNQHGLLVVRVAVGFLYPHLVAQGQGRGGKGGFNQDQSFTR